MTNSTETERAELVELNEWMREPDYAENFSLADATDWINRRPIATAARLAAQDQKPPPAPGWDEATRYLKKIADLADDENACDPLDDAISYANRALEALRHSAPPDHGGADAGVRVKPLEWEDADEGMCTKWRAEALGGHYDLVALDGEGGGLAVNFYWGRPLSFWFIQGDRDEWGDRTGPKMFPTLDEAKAAAQADYERRILSALSKPAPVAANASAEDYRNAIDDALVTRHLGVAKGDAKAELEQIMRWEVAVALDPSVSSDAQALIDSGANASAEARLREALALAFPILTRLAENQRQERGGSGLMEGPACNTAEYIAYLAARKALSAHPHASDCEKQATERWLKNPAVQEAVERRPDHPADVTVEQAAHLCADDLVLIVEAATKMAHRTGNTFVIDRARVASMIASHFNAFTMGRK